MTRVENFFSFFGRGSLIWNRGGNLSKFIGRGSHWGTSHRDTWAPGQGILNTEPNSSFYKLGNPICKRGN